MLDIAAGHGLFGIMLAQRNPRTEIVAVDWTAVLAVARNNAVKMGVGERYRTIAGDAFTVDFGSAFDVALVTNFLHHFDIETNVVFMRKVAAALPWGRAICTERCAFPCALRAADWLGKCGPINCAWPTWVP